MDAESIRRIQVASRVLWHFSNVNADPLTPSVAHTLRALAETEQEKFMELDDLACMVIRRAVEPAEKSKAESA
jgi:hypothetical protein